MTNEAKGPYELSENDIGRYVIGDLPQHLAAFESYAEACIAVGIANAAHSQALTTQAARVRELEEDREWLRSQWERHRKALNAIAWGEYDNVAFCRRLAQDELAIGVKVANDRAAATVAALTPKEPQQ
jgi:hypothetical protein